MPKLKKLSEIRNKSKYDTDSLQSIDASETQAQDSSLSSHLAKPTRMKCSQRMKLYDSQHPKTQLMQNQSPIQEQQANKYQASDLEMDLFMTKFTDNQDDDISVVQDNTRPPKTKSTKPPKTLLKTSNKMFSDLNFQESLEEQTQQSCQRLEIEIEKKDKRQNGLTMQKIQERAAFYKNKLEYKELAKDHRYRKNIHEKLKSIQDVEEVDLVVEIPKVLGGKNAQVQAALFLRNQDQRQKQKELHDHISSQLDQEETSLPKDRKLYYSQLQKQVKIKKAETMAPSKLKDCFKKSMLDDEDYICILEDRQGNYEDFIQSQHTKSRITDIQNRKLFEEHHKISYPTENNQNVNQDNQIRKELSMDRTQKLKQAKSLQKSQESVQQSKKLSNKPSQNVESKEEQSSAANFIKKTKKSSNRTNNRKRSQFSFKDFIEVQAQLSDDEQNGGKKHQDNQQSQQDDVSNVSSLIDDDAQQNTSDGYNLRKKFIQDMMQEQQKRYEQIRKKMQQKYLQEEERLKQRMKQAARKNHQKEKEDQVQLKKQTVIEQSNTEGSAESSTCTFQKQKNKEKLKQLQLMLGQQLKQERDVLLPKGVQKVGKLQELELGILHSRKPEYKKPDRNGFKNIQAHKQPTKIFRPKP